MATRPRQLPSGTWRAEYRDRSGRRHSVTRPSRRECAAAVADLEQQVRRGTWISPTDASTTLDVWVAAWRESRRTADTTAAKVESHLRLHILPALGDVPLNKLTRLAVQSWINELGMERPHPESDKPPLRPLAPETVKNVYNILTKILADAVEDGLLRGSPCRRIDLPRAPREERPFAEPATVVRIADLIAPHYRAMILTAAWTGMRWEEIGGLQRADCQLLRRKIVVRHALHEVAGRVWIDHKLKSDAARREIMLPPFLVDLLAAHMAQPGRTAEGCPECGGDPVFTGRDGALLRRQWGKRNLRPAAKLAGAAGLTFHGLRHSHRAWLLAAGIPGPAIDERMGHAHQGVQGLYTHILDEVIERVAAALEQMWWDARDASATHRGDPAHAE